VGEGRGGGLGISANVTGHFGHRDRRRWGRRLDLSRHRDRRFRRSWPSSVCGGAAWDGQFTRY